VPGTAGVESNTLLKEVSCMPNLPVPFLIVGAVCLILIVAMFVTLWLLDRRERRF
jgi:hypothetical protein